MPEVTQTPKEDTKLTPLTKYELFDHVIDVTLFKWKKLEGKEKEEALTDWMAPLYEEITLPNGDTFQSIRRYADVRVTDKGDTQYRYYKETYLPEKDNESVITIKCPDGGVKPGISVKYSLVGGEYCYQVVVDIVNLHISLDVRELCEMEITMGYRNISLRTLRCDIMTAYQLAPGPDSITRFQCLAVGSIGILTKPHPITIVFSNKTAKVSDIVMQSALALHDIGYPGVKEPPFAVMAKFECNQEIQDKELVVPKKKTFSNGAKVMSWLAQLLQQVGCYPYISEGELLCLSRTMSEEEQQALEEAFSTRKKDSEKAEQATAKLGEMAGSRLGETRQKEGGGGGVIIYELDRVTSASIQGGLVNITAPFVPQLRPGDLFKMQPNYFDGSSFLSERYIPMSLVVGDDTGKRYAIYRIIKMDIEFGTNNGANRMEILATPIAAEKIDLKTGFTTVQAPQVDAIKKGDVTVSTDQGNNRENPLIDWWSNIPDHGSEGWDYTVNTLLHPWDNCGLWEIALIVWSTDNNLEQAAKRWRELNNSQSEFNREWYTKARVRNWKRTYSEVPNDIPGLITRGNARIGYDGYWMWPLIAAFTYIEMQRDLKKEKGRMGYRITLNNPDLIRNGDVLRIPMLENASDMDKYKEYADMFMKMGELKAQLKFPDTRDGLNNIGLYLKN